MNTAVIENAVRSLHTQGVRVYLDTKNRRLATRQDGELPIAQAIALRLEGEDSYTWLKDRYSPQQFAWWRAIQGRDTQQIAADLLALLESRGTDTTPWSRVEGNTPALRVRMAALAVAQIDADYERILDELGFVGTDVQPMRNLLYDVPGEGPAPDAQEILGMLLDTDMDQSTASYLARTYDPKVIQRQAEWLPYRACQDEAAMLIASIKGDYGPPRELPAEPFTASKFYAGRYATCPRCHARPCVSECDHGRVYLMPVCADGSAGALYDF